MITAKEMKAKLEILEDKRAEEDLMLIENEFLSTSKPIIQFKYYFNSKVIKALKELGYKVTEYDGIDSNSSWKTKISI